jgi:hypothetical protein
LAGLSDNVAVLVAASQRTNDPARRVENQRRAPDMHLDDRELADAQSLAE